MNFDIFAENYRNILNESLKNSGYVSSYFAERKVVEILSHVKDETLESRLKILDLGCGDGLTAVYFRKYFSGSFISGLDISRECIEVSLNRNIANAEFNTYNGKVIPYNNSSFDIILLAGILHHLANRESRLNILRECYRVLRRDGILFIFEHNPYNPITLKIVNDCPFDDDAILIDCAELKKILGELGFKSKFRFIVFLPEFVKRKEFFEKLLYWIPFGGQYYTISKKAGY